MRASRSWSTLVLGLALFLVVPAAARADEPAPVATVTPAAPVLPPLAYHPPLNARGYPIDLVGRLDRSGRRQRTAGIVLVSVGTVASIASLALIHNGVNQRNGDNGYTFYGAFVAAHAAAALITGTVLWVRGSGKIARAQELGGTVAVTLGSAPAGSLGLGVGLRY